MVERVLASANVQRVAVGQERLAAAFLDEVRDRFRPVRPQKCEVARLTEVDFDGGELFVKVDAVHACRFHQTGQLLLQILGQRGAEIRKINLCFVHGDSFLSCLALFQ